MTLQLKKNKSHSKFSLGLVFLPIRDSYGTTHLILRRNNLPNDKLDLLITVQGTIIGRPKETINRVNKSVKIKFQATTIVTDRHEIENHSFQYRFH